MIPNQNLGVFEVFLVIQFRSDVPSLVVLQYDPFFCQKIKLLSNVSDPNKCDANTQSHMSFGSQKFQKIFSKQGYDYYKNEMKISQYFFEKNMSNGNTK